MDSWNETPAALLRNRGWYADDAALAKAREFSSVERRAARQAFDAAWSDASHWGTDSEGHLVNARAIQEELAARGWTGAWVPVPNTTPPALRPLWARRELEQTRQATTSPAGPGAEWERLEAEWQARYQAARVRQDAKLGPVARGLAFGRPEFGGL